MARPREDISENLQKRQEMNDYQPGEAPQAEDPGGVASDPPEENRFLDDPSPDDDALPEDLADAGGSQPVEGSEGDPIEDQDLSITDEDRIGAGKGLDEAEMGRADPLDGKPWDDDPKKSYGTD